MSFYDVRAAGGFLPVLCVIAPGRVRFLGESGWLVARANLWGWTPVVLAGYLWPMPGLTTGRPARATGNQARGLSTTRQ